MSWRRPIELFDVIGNAVDSIRKTNGINGVISSGSNYRYDSINTLRTNDFISITDGTGTHENLLIISADSTGFVISDNYPTAITYKANAPYYIHEEIAKGAEIFTEKTNAKGITVGWQKYPLVLLVHSYPQSQDSLDFAYESTFELYILTETKSEYRSGDRYSNTFDPILIPIQEDLTQALSDSNNVRLNTAEEIDKVWTDLLYVDNNPFPDRLDGIKIDITDLQIIDDVSCPAVAPTTFNLTLSSDENGSLTTNKGDEGDSPITVNSGDNVGAYAIANANYAFFRLLRNTIPVTQNPYPFIMNQDIDLVAEFILSIVDLIISVNGTGITDPVPGTYPTGVGSSEEITAIETDILHYFNEFTVDGVPDSNNPIIPTVNAEMNAIAFFLPFLQVVFGTTPVKIIDSYFWDDLTSNESNVKIKSQVIKLNGINSNILFTYLNGQTSAKFIIDIDSVIITGNEAILGQGVDIRISSILTSGNSIRARVQNSLSAFINIDFIGVLGNNTQLIIEINFTTSTITVNGEAKIVPSGLLATSFNDILLGQAAGIESLEGTISKIEVENKGLYRCKDSWGVVLRDWSGNDNNITVIGINETDFWSEKSYLAEPLETYTYALFQQIADDTKFIRANPEETTISGYNKIAEIPVNVGSNTGATYLWPVNAGLQAALPANFFTGDGVKSDEVWALVNDSLINITKGADATAQEVSLLKIKQ